MCGAMKVFVTSQTYNGNLGGTAGAHSKCQALATAAGLGGTFRAWIASDFWDSPKKLFSSTTLPYQLVTGEQIADNFNDLTDGRLDSVLNKNESGNLHTVTSTWSSTIGSGEQGGVASDCGDWTNGSTLSSYTGFISTTSFKWTWNKSLACNWTLPLYCFQQ